MRPAAPGSGTRRPAASAANGDTAGAALGAPSPDADDGRGRRAHLGCSLEDERHATERDWTPLDCRAERLRDLRRADPSAELGGDLVDRAEQVAYPVATHRGGEADGRVLEEGQPVAELLDNVRLGHQSLWHQIP